jgi:hypothetical protein
MPDNWGFVVAAYGLTAAVLALYWRHLVRKEKELRPPKTADSKGTDSRSDSSSATSARNVAGTATANTERTRQTSSSDREIAERSRQPSSSDREIAERSRQPSSSGHPRPDPTSRGPLQ